MITKAWEKHESELSKSTYQTVKNLLKALAPLSYQAIRKQVQNQSLMQGQRLNDMIDETLNYLCFHGDIYFYMDNEGNTIFDIN